MSQQSISKQSISKKIFIDVGGHYGETVEPVIDPVFGFDIIYTFEPVQECCDRIRQVSNHRVEIVQAGLSNQTTTTKIYNPGHVGASIFADIEIPNKDNDNFCLCQLIEASEFFRTHIGPSDRVYLKLNCEGSECDVVENLIISGEYSKVEACLIDFDVRKVPSQRHRKQELIELMNKRKIKNFYSSEDVLFGPSNYVAVRRWLYKIGAAESSIGALLKSKLHHIKSIFLGRNLPYYKWQIVRCLPQEFMTFYYRTIKRTS